MRSSSGRLSWAARAALGLAAGSAAAIAGEAPVGQVVDGVSCQSDPTKSYALYLPTSYAPQRPWPALLVFDPGGRGVVALEVFREAAESYGWVVLSSNDTRNGALVVDNLRAVDAMWRDLGTRYSVDRQRVYAAGFSAGAMLAWSVGQQPGVFAGIIASGGRLIPEYFAKAPSYAHFGAAGMDDFNFQGMRKVDQLLAGFGTLHRLEFFEGQHTWMPPELAREAVEWLELDAMRRSLRPRDESLIAVLYDKDAGKARGLETAGKLFPAWRRWRAVGDAFAALRDVAEAQAAVQRLAATDAVRDGVKDEERSERMEEEHLGYLFEALARVREGSQPLTTGRLASDLRISELERLAEEDSWKGVTARRLQQTFVAYTGNIVPRELIGDKRYKDAALLVAVAERIRPDSAALAYNHACFLALAGERKEAFGSLTRAIDLGFSDRALLEKDSDLDNLRADERFSALLARLPS